MINTEIYGTPETWGTSIMTGAGFKWVNFNDTTGAKPRLMDGAELEKTPHNELIENSVCTHALGTESKYCHIVVENGGAMYHSDLDYMPWFLSESDDTERNSQNNVSTILLDNHINAWKPYRASTYYWNYSDYCRPFAEWKPKKLLFNLKVVLRNSTDVTSQPVVYSIYNLTPGILADYPYVSFAYLETYVDGSETDTPNRHDINQYSQFGVSPNVQFEVPNIENFQIDYACFKSILKNAIPIWGMNTAGFNEGSNIINIGLCEEDDIYVYENGVICAREYDDDFKEYLIQQAACFGLFVRIANDSELTINEIPLDNNDIILGVLDEDGVGHGEYTRGADNRNNKIWDWETNQDSDYDPYTPPGPVDPNQYEDSTTLPSWVDRAQGNNVYINNPSAMGSNPFGLTQGVVNEIKSLNEMQFNSLFVGQEPLENILASRTIHLKPPSGAQLTAEEDVQLAAYTCQTVSAPKLRNDFTRVEFPPKPIFPTFGNFLDYEPYTTVSIYIPYCGAMKLPTAVFMGHSCKFTLNINIRTGEIEAIIYVDNIEFATISGNAGEDFAVTGLAMSTYASKKRELEYKQDQVLLQGIMSLAGHVAGSTISGSMGNVGGVMSQAVMAGTSIAQASLDYYFIDYELDHIAPASLLIQKSNASIAQLNCLTPFILIMRPTYEPGFNEESYAKTVGHACYRIGNLKSFHGMTSAINPVLDDISATLTEKQMIIDALREGVILDDDR